MRSTVPMASRCVIALADAAGVGHAHAGIGQLLGGNAQTRDTGNVAGRTERALGLGNLVGAQAEIAAQHLEFFILAHLRQQAVGALVRGQCGVHPRLRRWRALRDCQRRGEGDAKAHHDRQDQGARTILTGCKRFHIELWHGISLWCWFKT